MTLTMQHSIKCWKERGSCLQGDILQSLDALKQMLNPNTSGRVAGLERHPLACRLLHDEAECRHARPTWQAPGSCSWTAAQPASDSTTWPPFAQAARSSVRLTPVPAKCHSFLTTVVPRVNVKPAPSRHVVMEECTVITLHCARPSA